MYYKASKEMLSNPSLNDSEKLLMIVIEGLSQKEGYCFATNKALADMLGWDVRKVMRVVGTIVQKKFATKDFINNNGRSLRRITPTTKNCTDYNNCHGGDTQIVTDGGTQIVTGGVHNLSPILEEVNTQDKNRLKDNAQKERSRENFEVFWDVYDKKIDRSKCWAKFSKLKESEQNAILLNVQDYVAANPETQFRKNPLTYLNGRCWEDEIITFKKLTNAKGFSPEIDQQELENWIKNG